MPTAHPTSRRGASWLAGCRLRRRRWPRISRLKTNKLRHRCRYATGGTRCFYCSAALALSAPAVTRHGWRAVDVPSQRQRRRRGPALRAALGRHSGRPISRGRNQKSVNQAEPSANRSQHQRPAGRQGAVQALARSACAATLATGRALLTTVRWTVGSRAPCCAPSTRAAGRRAP